MSEGLVTVKDFIEKLTEEDRAQKYIVFGCTYAPSTNEVNYLHEQGYLIKAVTPCMEAFMEGSTTPFNYIIYLEHWSM